MSESHIRTMVWRVIQEIHGLSKVRDFELIAALMRYAVANGQRFEGLKGFKGINRTPCFGFFRDSSHYAGVCYVELSHGWVGAIMVQTAEQRFAGNWVFTIGSGSVLLTSHNGKPVTVAHGYEGLDLFRAVVESSLTDTTSSRSWWRRR